MSPELQTFFTAMLPVLELRAAIPVAILVHGMDPFLAYLLAVLGNIIPIFLILSFLDPVSAWLSSRSVLMKRFFNALFQRTRKKHNARVSRYGFFALFLFTAIPLPISGAWTASLVVFLFGLPYARSVISIIGGVLLAGAVVTIASKAGVSIQEDLQIVGGLLLLVLFVYFIYHRRRNNKNEQTGTLS